MLPPCIGLPTYLAIVCSNWKDFSLLGNLHCKWSSTHSVLQKRNTLLEPPIVSGGGKCSFSRLLCLSAQFSVVNPTNPTI